MAWSGLSVLVVECVGKFSLLEGGRFFFFLLLHYNGAFLIHVGSMKTVLVVI